MDGEFRTPVDDSDWDSWVSASTTRNHVLDNPLLDWLERHGEAKGYERDGPDTIDPRTDFLTFIFAKGAGFEEAVVRHLRTLVPVHVPEGAEGNVSAPTVIASNKAPRGDPARTKAHFLGAPLSQGRVKGLPSSDVEPAAKIPGGSVLRVPRWERG